MSARSPRPVAHAAEPSVGVTVVSFYFQPDATGIAPYATDLAKAAAALGHQVRVVCGVPHYPEWRTKTGYRRGLVWHETLGSISVTRVRHWVPKRPRVLGRGLLEATFFASALRALLRDRSAVLMVMTPTIGALAACLLARRRRPVGVIVQDLVGQGASESGAASTRLGSLISRLECALLRRADRVGIITEAFEPALLSGGVDRERISLIPNFSRTRIPDIDKVEARRALGWEPTGFVLVHAGNIGQKQGLEAAVDAARHAALRYPDVRLVLVGDGNQRSAIEAHAHGCSNVSLVGQLPEETFPLALCAADALLLIERPGVVGMSLPSKLTSYVEARRPIIASVEPHGATGRLLDRLDIALMSRPGDAEAIVASVESIRFGHVDVEQLLERIRISALDEFDATAGRQRYERFCSDLLRLGRDRHEPRLAGTGSQS